VPIPTTKTALVYNNGTDVVTSLDYIPSLTLGAALPIASGGTGSTSTTYANLTTNVTGTLPFANGGTGLSTLGTVGQALLVNSGATALEYGTAGITTGKAIAMAIVFGG
jgi:hypothetical protein